MGEIIAGNILSWLELLINRFCCICLVCISFIKEGIFIGPLNSWNH